MKLAAKVALSTALLSTSAIVLASTSSALMYHVPFQHVEVKATKYIQVKYSFNSEKDVLVCRADQGGDALSTVAWAYKSVLRQIGLPVRLKGTDKTQGAWADPTGKLVIINHFGSSEPNGSMFVTCNYQSIA